MEKLQATLLTSASEPAHAVRAAILTCTLPLVYSQAHVLLWLSHEHFLLTATTTFLVEHLAEVMPFYIPRFCWTPSKLFQENTPFSVTQDSWFFSRNKKAGTLVSILIMLIMWKIKPAVPLFRNDWTMIITNLVYMFPVVI